ncbi:DUF6197 family protein [Streptomyces jumonjinensis]|uniref:DUF6197 family protein n=1 Tax=Streptomyces jumonjinensis TaxID=1945 RepID=UPI003794A0BA
MTTSLTATASSRTAETVATALVGEIERYLAAQPRPAATAHPLVTRTTDQLVAEALAHTPPSATAAGAPALAVPARALRVLPDWALSVPLVRQLHGGYGRRLTPATHLTLTALVIERYGWSHGKLRTRSGRRCILGAQAVLYRLGYGDEQTVHQAAGHLQAVLAQRGIHQHYATWNDAPGRTQIEVLALVRAAATRAETDR